MGYGKFRKFKQQSGAKKQPVRKKTTVDDIFDNIKNSNLILAQDIMSNLHLFSKDESKQKELFKNINTVLFQKMEENGNLKKETKKDIESDSFYHQFKELIEKEYPLMIEYMKMLQKDDKILKLIYELPKDYVMVEIGEIVTVDLAFLSPANGERKELKVTAKDIKELSDNKEKLILDKFDIAIGDKIIISNKKSESDVEIIVTSNEFENGITVNKNDKIYLEEKNEGVELIISNIESENIFLKTLDSTKEYKVSTEDLLGHIYNLDNNSMDELYDADKIILNSFNVKFKDAKYLEIDNILNQPEINSDKDIENDLDMNN